jgi:hypothetical protein
MPVYQYATKKVRVVHDIIDHINNNHYQKLFPLDETDNMSQSMPLHSVIN